MKYRSKIFNLVTVSAIVALERFILQLGVLANRDHEVRKTTYPSILDEFSFRRFTDRTSTVLLNQLHYQCVTFLQQSLGIMAFAALREKYQFSATATSFR